MLNSAQVFPSLSTPLGGTKVCDAQQESSRKVHVSQCGGRIGSVNKRIRGATVRARRTNPRASAGAAFQEKKAGPRILGICGKLASLASICATTGWTGRLPTENAGTAVHRWGPNGFFDGARRTSPLLS